jgi:hypothetical protein
MFSTVDPPLLDDRAAVVVQMHSLGAPMAARHLPRHRDQLPVGCRQVGPDQAVGVHVVDGRVPLQESQLTNRLRARPGHDDGRPRSTQDGSGCGATRQIGPGGHGPGYARGYGQPGRSGVNPWVAGGVGAAAGGLLGYELGRNEGREEEREHEGRSDQGYDDSGYGGGADGDSVTMPAVTATSDLAPGAQ